MTAMSLSGTWRAVRGSVEGPGLVASGEERPRICWLCGLRALWRWRLSSHQPSHPNQVVGGRHEVAGKASAGQTPVARSPEPAHRLHPTEDLLDPLPQPLTERIAAMPGRVPVDGAGAPAHVLRHARGDAAGAHRSHAAPRVVARVRAEHLGMEPASCASFSSTGAASRSAVSQGLRSPQSPPAGRSGSPSGHGQGTPAWPPCPCPSASVSPPGPSCSGASYLSTVGCQCPPPTTGTEGRVGPRKGMHRYTLCASSCLEWDATIGRLPQFVAGREKHGAYERTTPHGKLLLRLWGLDQGPLRAVPRPARRVLRHQG